MRRMWTKIFDIIIGMLLVQGLFTHLIAQNHTTLTGNVCDKEDKPVDYFNALLLSIQDSTLIKGDVYYDGKFRMENVPSGSYLLRIANVKYQTLDTVISLSGGPYILSGLRMNDLYLDEVVVMGRKKMFKQSHGNFSLDIKNSFLKNEITILDILRKSPGVLVDNEDNISVFGRENTLVLINGKEMRTKSELNTIRPSDVEEIEIIKNPSAGYDAEVSAVIEIRTKENLGDRLDFSITHQSFFGRKYSGENGFNGGFRIGNFLNYLSYSFANGYNQIYDLNRSEIRHEKDVTFYERGDTNRWKKKAHNIFYSLSYQPDEKTSMGLQYMGNLDDHRSNRDEWQNTHLPSEKKQMDIYVMDKTHNFLHNLGFNLKHKPDAHRQFSLLADYAFAGQSMDSWIDEYNLTDHTFMHSEPSYEDKYSIFSTNADFRSTAEWLDYSSGFKYSFLHDNAISNKLQDQIAALYLTGEKQFSSFTMNAGFRVEYTSSHISFTDGQDEPMDKKYWDYFPSFRLSNKFSDRLSLSGGYSRKIARVPFSWMNPRYRYLDALSYNIGNPSLRPTYHNQLDLNLEMGQFLFTLEYKFSKDLVVPVNRTEDEQSDMIQHTYINLDDSKSLVANLTYQGNYRRLSNYASLSVEKPFLEIPFSHSIYNAKKPLWQFQYMGNLNIFDNTSLTLYFLWRSSGDKSTLRFDSFNNLYLSVDQYFFDKKLQVSLTINDILNQYKTNNWTNRYENVTTVMDCDQDSRKLKVTLRYNFGLSKIKVQKESANTESLRRR